MNSASEYYFSGCHTSYTVYVDRKQVDVLTDRNSAMTVLFSSLLSEKLQNNLEDSYILQSRYVGQSRSIEECVYRVVVNDAQYTFVKVISNRANSAEYTTVYSPHDTDIFGNMFNYNLFSQLKAVVLSDKTQPMAERRKYASVPAPRCANTRPNIRSLPPSAIQSQKHKSQSMENKQENTKDQSLKDILKQTLELSTQAKPIESTRLIEKVVLFKEQPKTETSVVQKIDDASSESDTTTSSGDTDNSDDKSLNDEETKKLEDLLDNMFLNQQTLAKTVKENKKVLEDDKDNLANYECELRFQKMLNQREIEKNEEKQRVFSADIGIYHKLKEKLQDPSMNMTEKDIPDLFEAKYYVFKYLDVNGYLDAITSDEEKNELYRLYNALYNSRFPPDDDYVPPDEYVNEVLEFMTNSFMPDKIQTVDDIMSDLNKGSHNMFKEDPSKLTFAETSIPCRKTTGMQNAESSDDSDNSESDD